MKHIAIALTALTALSFSAPVIAQQAPFSPEAICGQLRGQDTAQIIALIGEIGRLQGELKALKTKEAEAAKPKDPSEK